MAIKGMERAVLQGFLFHVVWSSHAETSGCCSPPSPSGMTAVLRTLLAPAEINWHSLPCHTCQLLARDAAHGQ